MIPTDTVYALACDIHATPAIERIARMKQVKPGKANFSFICRDLNNISEFTRPFNTEIFRLMKSVLPGPFTFILNANSNVPAIFKSNKRPSVSGTGQYDCTRIGPANWAIRSW